MELIRINKNNTVAARDLHSFLESRRDFSNWLKAKVLNNPYFDENTDYFLLNNSGEQVRHGGNNRVDYDLTIDTAKKVAMSEQTEQGNKVRDYFLACENELKNRFAIPQTLSQALLLASKQAEQIEMQQKQIEANSPKVEFHDAVMGSKTTADLGTVSKVLNYKGYGRNKLFELLRSRGILMNNNRPFQKYVDSGYFRVVEYRYMVNAEERIGFKTTVFQKGVKFIKKILDEATK